MKLLNKIALRYVAYAFPLVLILFAMGFFVNLNDPSFSSSFLHSLWNILVSNG